MSRPPHFVHIVRAAAIALTLGGLAPSLAVAQPLPVPSAGVIPDVPGATDKPVPSRTYKLAADIVSMPKTPDEVSPALVSLARLINTYRQAGVPAANIQTTAVFHGPTIVQVTTDATYEARTKVKTNPNVEIIRQLEAAGVKFVVCGVSAREQGYTAADIRAPAHLNLSASVTFIDLQLQGYVKFER